MIHLLLRYLKSYRLQLALVFAFVLCQAICQLFLPNMMGDIVDNGVAAGNNAYIWHAGGMMLAISLIAAVCMVASSYFSAYVTASFTSRIRADVFDKVKSFSRMDYERFGTGTLLTRSTTDATQMQIVVINGLRSMLLIPITGLGALIMAFRENVLLTMVLLGAFSLILLIIFRSTKQSLPFFKTKQEKIDRLNLLIKEKLTGVRTIRAFRRQEYETEKFAEANADSMQASIKASYAVAFFTPFMQLVMNITVVVILLMGANQVQLNILQVGDLLVFVQYVLLFMSSLSLVSVILMAYPQAQVSAARVKEVLDSDLIMRDPKNPKPFENICGRIEFKNVSFEYSGAEKPVLSGLDFVAEPGKVTAVVGATGSGKSTLVQLIMRLYDVSEGEILIDGIDIRDCRQADLHRAVTYSPQKSVLFGGTFAENIKFGIDTATEEEVTAAAMTAQIYELISERENGLESTIYQGGKDLSGGQRQRLSIARALLKKAPVAIFDDCFSALDFKTEAQVRKGILKELEGVTIILVAQRISTIKDADKILVLSNGEIVGQGKHEELVKSCPVYQEILKSQSYYERRDQAL